MPADNLIQLADETQLRSVLEETAQTVVIYFWADWAAQCAQVSDVIGELAKKFTKTHFFKVEAEEFAEISEAYDIAAVPTVVIAKKDKILGRVDGVNAAEIVNQVTINCSSANGVGPRPADIAAPVEFKQDLNTRLKGLIERAPVMVFIKGTAAQPRCGFSKKIIGMLNEQGVKYGYFDILSDEEVRQGLKEYSNWPTYPQLYIDGELVGGVDIVTEMIESGELAEMIPADSKAE
ncbi:glutaredoxin [Martensiomyces pterosporus]|nr:glutaredoxin [Martensiomyces pterosporus]